MSSNKYQVRSLMSLSFNGISALSQMSVVHDELSVEGSVIGLHGFVQNFTH